MCKPFHLSLQHHQTILRQPLVRAQHPLPLTLHVLAPIRVSCPSDCPLNCPFDCPCRLSSCSSSLPVYDPSCHSCGTLCPCPGLDLSRLSLYCYLYLHLFLFSWPFTNLAIHWVMESTSIGWGPELLEACPGLVTEPFEPTLDPTTNSISCFIKS